MCSVHTKHAVKLVLMTYAITLISENFKWGHEEDCWLFKWIDTQMHRWIVEECLHKDYGNAVERDLLIL